MASFSTLFASMLRNKEIQQQRQIEEQRYQDQRHDQAVSQMMAEKDQAQKEEDAVFQRKLKVAELMGKSAGSVGAPQPTFSNPAVQEFSNANYGAGTSSMQLEQQKRAFDLRKQAEDQLLGLKNTSYEDIGDEADAARTALVNQRLGTDINTPLTARTPPERRATAAGGKDPRIGLQENYLQHPRIKRAMQVADFYHRVKSVPLNGVGDVPLLVGYIHMIEPDSVVREGEFDRQLQTGEVPGWAVGLWKKMAGGGFLADETRKGILNDADRVMRETQASKREVDAEYAQYLRGLGFEPSQVMLGAGMGGSYYPGARGQQPAPAPAPEPSGLSDKDQHYMDLFK